MILIKNNQICLIKQLINDGDDKGKDDRDDKGGKGGKDDGDDGDDGDDKSNKNKNITKPLFYDVNHDFRAYEKDFNKATSLESKFDFMNKFSNDIMSLINLPFKENRGTKEQAEARKNRKNDAIASIIDLYNKLYVRYSR